MAYVFLRTTSIGLRYALASLVLLAFVEARPLHADPIVLVVPSASPLHDLSTRELTSILRAEVTSIDSEGADEQISTRVFIDQNVERRLLGDVLGTSPRRFRRTWAAGLISGKLSFGAETIADPLIFELQIKSHPGAIGATRLSSVPPGVRTLTIDGLSPASDRYPLSSGGGVR